MSEQLRIPRSLWVRLAAFLVPGRFGRIELEVHDGRIVKCRLMESVKVSSDELGPGKERSR